MSRHLPEILRHLDIDICLNLMTIRTSPKLLYALSWVAVRGMLVCGCPASKGGILRAISPAGRRFRASALVYGHKITMYIPYMCTFFFFAFPTLGLWCWDCTAGIST